jgi:hypothetical protein
MCRKRNNVFEVLSIYTHNYDGRYYVRELAKKTTIPLKTCQQTLEQLEQQSLLKSVIKGKHKYYSLNKERSITQLYLQQAEIYKTIRFLEHNPSFLLFHKHIRTSELIVLFGSYAKHNAQTGSDIDLLTTQQQELPVELLPGTPHIIFMNEQTLTTAIQEQEPLIKEVEEHHIILNNHSQYVQSQWNHYATKKH